MPATFDASGRPVALANRLGRGGEGEVFAVHGQPDLAAKVLQAARRARKFAKVRAMVEHPPAGAYEAVEGLPVLTWPRALLFDSATRRDESTFVGYTMTRVTPRDFVPIYQLTSSRRRHGLAGIPLTWDRLLLLGLRLAHLVRILHRFGYAVGDLNDRNVLVSRRLTPLLMDTDSFEVPDGRGGRFQSVVGDQLYWPPDLLDVDLAKHKGSREGGDRYALGVLLFQLFMDGLRPYQSRGSAVASLDSLVDKTRAGHYPWSSPKPGVLEPPPNAPPYRALPASVRSAFERCFVAGHHKPGKRPSAEAWNDTLQDVWQAGFATCTSQARHVYPRELRSCPWCGQSNDPFVPSSRTAAARPRPQPTPRLAKPAPVTAKSRAKGGSKRKAAPQWSPSTPSTQSSSTPSASPPSVPVRPGRPTAASVKVAKPTTRAKSRPAPAPASGPSWLETTQARVLWPVALLLVLALPGLALAAGPDGLERKAVTATSTTLLVGGLGAAILVPLLATATSRWLATWLSFGIALVATLVLAVLGKWLVLLWGASFGSFAAGLVVFALLQRRAGEGLRPTRRSLLHGAVSLPVAALPTVAFWIWRGLA